MTQNSYDTYIIYLMLWLSRELTVRVKPAHYSDYLGNLILELLHSYYCLLLEYNKFSFLSFIISY